MMEDFKQELLKQSMSRFTVLVSPSKKASNEIAYFMSENNPVIVCGNKIEDVREIINVSYKQTAKIIYLFPDADNMSLAAKNAMLKVTEEPPQQAYFIMCISSRLNTINTILSRGTVIEVPELSILDIREYALKKDNNLDDTNLQAVLCYAKTYEQVDKLLALDSVQEFVDFVDKVVDNLAYVTVTNSLKILNSLSFKEDDNKYDIHLFLNIFYDRLTRKYLNDGLNKQVYSDIMASTLQLQTKLQIPSLNKQNLMELWMMKQWEIFGGEKIE